MLNKPDKPVIRIWHCCLHYMDVTELGASSGGKADTQQSWLSSKELNSIRHYSFTGLVSNSRQEKQSFLLPEAGQAERPAAPSAVKHVPCNGTDAHYSGSNPEDVFHSPHYLGNGTSRMSSIHIYKNTHTCKMKVDSSIILCSATLIYTTETCSV